MSKKKFEEMGYDPLGAILKRDAARKQKLDEQKLPKPAPKREAPPKPEATAPVKAPEKVVELQVKKAVSIPETKKRTVKSPQPMKKKADVQAEPGRRRRLPASRVEYERKEQEAVEDFLHRLSRKSGSKFSYNILGRCLVRIAMAAEREIHDELERAAPRPRPANKDAIGLGEYEDEWERVLQRALLRSPGR